MSHCLFDCFGFYVPFFHSYGDVTITSEGSQILTNTWHSAIEQRGIFSVPHLLWNGASIYNGNFWESVTLTPVPIVWHWSCHFLFLRLRSVAAGIRTPNLPHVRWALVKILSNNKQRITKSFNSSAFFFIIDYKMFWRGAVYVCTSYQKG